jgi:hypothetical protein
MLVLHADVQPSVVGLRVAGSASPSLVYFTLLPRGIWLGNCRKTGVGWQLTEHMGPRAHTHSLDILHLTCAGDWMCDKRKGRSFGTSVQK